jgi:hypothetical protein
MLCKLNALWILHLFCLINCVLCRYYVKLTGWRKNRFTLDGNKLPSVSSDFQPLCILVYIQVTQVSFMVYLTTLSMVRMYIAE